MLLVTVLFAANAANAQQVKVKIGNGPWECACGDCKCDLDRKGHCSCDSGYKAEKRHIDYDAWSCKCGFICGCNPCRCKKHYAGTVDIEKELKRMDAEVAALKDAKHPKVKPPLTKRVWVEDVSRPGHWYFGWYDYDDHKFHYTRHEVRNALSNFRSLVPYSRAYDNPRNGQPWGVVYDP